MHTIRWAFLNHKEERQPQVCACHRQCPELEEECAFLSWKTNFCATNFTSARLKVEIETAMLWLMVGGLGTDVCHVAAVLQAGRH